MKTQTDMAFALVPQSKAASKPAFWASTKTCEWSTPQAAFDDLNAEFAFTLDICATAENAKCPRYFTAETDGLMQSWAGERAWVNPPYGRGIGVWVRKAYAEAIAGSTVCMLLPANTDTAWFHDYCVLGEIRFIRGRLKFGNSKSSAPFASMIVIFTPDSQRREER